MSFKTQLKVRFGDEDHAQIVYYPRFFHFFHCAFEDFFDTQGHVYRECLTLDRVGWPAVRAEADYRTPVRFGQILEIEVWLSRVGTKSATFHYTCRLPEGEVACVGKVVVACISMDTFKAQPIPDKYRALFEGHLEPERDGSQE